MSNRLGRWLLCFAIGHQQQRTVIGWYCLRCGRQLDQVRA
jgi:hypothetical protein